MRALLAVCLVVAPAFADGIVLPGNVFQASIPDQRAILSFDGERERLVIETTAWGTGSEFAWVVPLPAEPKVTPVSAGAFRTLEMHLRPELVDDGGGLALFAFVAFGVIGGCWWVLVRYRREAWVILLVGAVLFACIGAAVVLASVRGSPEGATVLRSMFVGSYELRTVQAASGPALAESLAADGFRVGPPVREAIDSLAAEGWFFVVGRLRTRGPGDETFRPHPLCFEFPTREAIYPMRLTAAEGKAIQLELYVLGASRAEVDPLRVEACARVVPLKGGEYPENHLPVPGEGMPLAQPELLSIGTGAAVVTRLAGPVGGNGRSSDLRLRWVPFDPARRAVYSSDGAYGRAADAGAVAFALCVLCAFPLRRRWSVRARFRLSWALRGVDLARHRRLGTDHHARRPG